MAHKHRRHRRRRASEPLGGRLRYGVSAYGWAAPYGPQQPLSPLQFGDPPADGAPGQGDAGSGGGDGGGSV